MKNKRPKKKIGISLGGGSARGLAHIGVLRVLQKNKIYPDYISGTSMGAVIGASYASGNSPNQLEEIALNTNWNEMVDFNLPWNSIIKGHLAKNKIRQLVNNKNFEDLDIPFRTIAYNITKKRKEIFYSGDLVNAIRASISIPGIFDPAEIKKDKYIDGGVVDPNPIDLVKDMGADIIISVDLFHKIKTKKSSKVKKSSFIQDMKKKFIAEELLMFRNYIEPKRWPKFIRGIILKTFDKSLYPTKIMRMFRGKELPQIAKILFESQNILFTELAKERSKNSIADIKIRPKFSDLDSFNFDQIEEFIKLGENATKEKISEIKKSLKIK